MNKIATGFIAIGVLIAGIAVAYYFLISLPKINHEESLAENQANCLKLSQSMVDEEKQGLSPGEYPSASNHYSDKFQKCFVELDLTSISSTQISNYYNIYDALENKLLIDCFITDNIGLDSSKQTSVCNAYSNPEHAGHTIPKDEFDKLEAQYMTQ